MDFEGNDNHPISGDSRRYRITSILGRGGFGTVYRARLEGSEGFHKDVAIKILRDADPPQEILARFRDEARILGLVRDPHVVSVDPPVRLDGRWAVVMEFVDGTSCEELLQAMAFPPQAALEICEVVARTLDHLWTAEDGNGGALRLVHRDLKPSNIQLTPNGHVKLLDFGVARADFDTRETHTNAEIGGTPGYMAPERMNGVDSHESDVYSLGVVLHRLVAKVRPKPGARLSDALLADPDIAAVVLLAERMRALDPAERPLAREVAVECRHLRAAMPPFDFATWAKTHVPATPQRPPDALVGRTLSETISQARARTTLPTAARRAPPEDDRRMKIGIALIAFGFVGMAFSGLAFAAIGWRLLATDGSAMGSIPAVPAPEAPTPMTAVPEVAPTDELAPVPAPEPDPAAPEPAPPRNDTSKTTRPRPGPAPAPTPEPEPVAATGTVRVEGEARQVQLLCGGQTFPPGPVPAGSCDVLAWFGDAAKPVPAGRVTVTADGAVTLRCVANFGRCKLQ